MSSTHHETEIKYLLPRAEEIPDLAVLSRVDEVGAPHETHLQAIYYDTPTASLARHNITLRRRNGAADDGWHLKTPGHAPDERLEHRVAPSATTSFAEPGAVPDELAEVVRAFVRSRSLTPIATIETRRTERTLRGPDDDELAVVADDVVRAHLPADGPDQLVAWREVEVELIDGSPKLLESCRHVFRQAGLKRSPFASKLHHALGDRTTPRDLPALDSTAGSIAVRHLAEQTRELLERDLEVRTEEPDGVHKMRVATRRLRSALATYGPLFDRTQTDPIREELKWLGAVLGEVRDLEVLRSRIGAHARELRPDLSMGPVVQRIDVELGNRQSDGYAHLTEALGSDRYFALLDDLERVVDEPPFSDRATRPAAKETRRLVGRSARRVRRAAGRVEQAETEDDRSTALHDVRKAAKRARYAAESAVPALGKRSTRLAAAMEDVQELLGEVQDTVASRRLLRELGALTHGVGENGFSFGLLYGREEEIAESELLEYESTFHKSLRAAKRL